MILNDLDKLVIFLGFGFISYFYYKHYKRSSLPLPPGPKKHPLLGNLLDMPTSHPWQKYAEWSKQFNSNIIHAYAAGTNLVVVNSFDVANELGDRRSAIYSHRPGLPMFNDLMGWGSWAFAAMGYGDLWRERRRTFQKYFHTSNGQLYRPIQIEFIRKMLPRLLENPKEFRSISRYAVASTIMTMTYGVDVKETDDPLINLAEAATESAALAILPGAFLVDTIPILKYIPEFVPGAGFQKQARIWRKLQEDSRVVPYLASIAAMAAGRARPSFVSMALGDVDESHNSNPQRDVIQEAAGMTFMAGTDSTASSVHSFFLAMICFPQVQMKAQQDLDRVLSGRLPEFSDMEDLPYVSAIAKEILRWQPAAPIGIPHCTTQDDVYEGYHIPKGSTVIFNGWAMLHNEDDYPDPFTFNPERFMKDGQLNPNIRDPDLMAFGFGRRLCPGSHIAFTALWLTVATVLATFNLSKAVDEDGKVMEPSIECGGDSLTRRPLPFECTIKPRSDVAERLIRSVVDSF